MTSDSSTGQIEFPPSRWLSWLLGIAALFAVVIAVRHFSEEKAFVRLAGEAKPLWVLAALTLQAATYLAQGEIWRTVGRMAGIPLSVTLVYELALAKLFYDQAIPSAGLSGTVVVAQALEERGSLPRSAIFASIEDGHCGPAGKSMASRPQLVCPQHSCFEDLLSSYPWLPDFGFLAASAGIALRRKWKLVFAQNPNGLDIE